ncbi:hydroxyacid dehydrogenase [Actinocatenispora rupis]|uniref:Dehydrogenase n=1 Tax=Actinocatenispora rupis TaxID=519421 RepID=A0A8J3IXN8_9ACTN|nr:hydroxyacid dehydrogenase [Actinocatenispora rupis]GID10568.1 dehydrogenase [Actinocatenispora rupis]
MRSGFDGAGVFPGDRREKLRIAISMRDADLSALFTPPVLARLHEVADLTTPDVLGRLDTADAYAALATAEVLLTGWGTPRVDAAVLDHAPKLRAIVHSAGTVKTFLGDEVFGRGIQVSSAADANAVPVAEYTLAAIVFGAKRVSRFAHQLRTRRATRSTKGLPQIGTNGITLGIVGASRIGRRVIMLARNLDATVLVADPYLTPSEAAALGAQAVDLDTLCRRSTVVSVHAPQTPATRHLLNARRLALLPDGAVVINTARGSIVDTGALTAELVSGRLDAVLDVTDPEPLPPDSPLYDLPNVLLTPHVAGALGNEVHRLGEQAVAELERLAAGAPLAHPIHGDELSHIA